ncbi:MAG: glycosyltransferase [Xenococcaceae cyanobacterium MO_188.B32]|nr:glycosyltransferase [Xenococcaceae cyanobacterium MO_188.B32]
MDSLPTPKNSAEAIKVLTPHLSSRENKYLECLWSSVRACGVEVDILNLDQPFAQFKKVYTSGDVIHLQWVETLCRPRFNKKYSWYFLLRNLRRLIFLKSQGYQLVWTVHNTLAHECSSPKIEKSLRWFLRYLCSDIIVMSEYSRREFARMYRRTKRVHIIPHGNYIGFYPNQVSRVDARHKLGIAPQQKVLLYFGMVRHYKGINHLIAAFNQLKDSNVVLLIAGIPYDPDLCAEIEQAAQRDSRIRLRLEFIPDEDIQIYMNACDWVVLPYQKILNSGSVLLALSFARPVIVPQRGAITELISNDEQGYCYEKDCDLLATINRALATTDQKWEQMCIQAYALAQKHDWSKIGDQLYQVYSYCKQ